MSARPSARRRGYDRAWDKARAGHLRDHPWCVKCAQQDRQTPAAVVDHIKPHRGDQRLFWDRTNWQSLCGTHHNATKQREEARGGVVLGVDAEGRPLDPDHPWNRRG